MSLGHHRSLVFLIESDAVIESSFALPVSDQDQAKPGAGLVNVPDGHDIVAKFRALAGRKPEMLS